MVYLVASLVSVLVLGGSLGLIVAMIRGSHERIIGALLGQPIDRQIAIVRDVRPRRRVTSVTRSTATPLRAAA